MRTRNLKPGFFKNEVLASLPPLCRILFQGLWCLADRNGRLEDRPLRIKAEVLPYDDCPVEEYLQLLEKNGFIIRYSVNNENYIQITTFSKHQTPHVKESEGTIPPPTIHKKNTKKTPCPSGVKTSINLYTDNLYTDILYTDSLNNNINKKEKEKEIHKEKEREKEKFLLSSFEEFWKIYPRKAQKGYAKKIWFKLKPDQELFEKILRKIEVLKETEQWQRDGGKYIPYPSTWLNREGWEDEPFMPKKINPYLQGLKTLTEEIIYERGRPEEVLCIDGETGDSVPGADES